MKRIFVVVMLAFLAVINGNVFSQSNPGVIGYTSDYCGMTTTAKVVNVTSPFSYLFAEWQCEISTFAGTYSVYLNGTIYRGSTTAYLELDFANNNFYIITNLGNVDLKILNVSWVKFRRGIKNSAGYSYFTDWVVYTKIDETTHNAGNIGTDQTICYGGNPSLLTSVSEPIGYVGVQWQYYNIDRWSNISGATNLTYQPPASPTLTTKYRRVATTICGNKLNSNEVTIEVSGAMTGGEIRANQDLCYNTQPSKIIDFIAPQGGHGTWVFAWESSPNGTSSWTTVSGANSFEYTPPLLTTTTYFKRKSSNTCGSVYSNSVKITVALASSGGTIAGNNTICSNTAPPKLTNSTAGSGGLKNFSMGVTYQWEYSTNNVNWYGISGTNSLEYQPPALAVKTYYRRKYMADCEVAYSNVVTIDIAPSSVAGSIKLQSGSSTICHNSQPSLLVTNTDPSGGKGIWNYQWQYCEIWDNRFYDISGANGETYQPPVLVEEKKYRRKETNDCDVVYSNEIIINLYSPTLVGEVGTNQTICYNTSPNNLTNVRLPDGGTGAWTYQWQISTTGTGGWSDISGETSATLNPGVLTATRYYRRREINTCATNQVTIMVTITVASAMSGGVVESNQNICYNTQPNNFTNFTSPSGGKGTTSHQWFSSSSGGEPWTSISGASGLTYQAGNLISRTYFQRRTTNDCGTVNSNSLDVQVANQLVAGEISGSQAVCYNVQPTVLNNAIAPSGGKGTKSYKWYSSLDGSNWSLVSGANALTYQPPQLTQTTHYRREVLDSECSGTVFSNVVTVTVYTQMVAGLVGTSQEICYNTAPNALTNSTLPSGGNGGWTLQWQSSVTGTGSWQNISGENGGGLVLSSMVSTLHYRRLETNSCGAMNSNVVTVTVAPQVVAGVVEDNQNICYNTAPNTFVNHTSPSGGKGAFTYQWQSSINGSTGWSDISGANSSSYTHGVLTSNLFFKRKEINTCVTVSSNVVSVQVGNPVTVGTVGQDHTICRNTSAETFSSIAVPSGGVGAWSYQWQKSSDGVSGWSNIGGANSITYNAGLLQETAYFRRNEVNQCSNQNSNILLITVAEAVNGGEIGSNQVVCYNATPAPLTNIALPTGGLGGFTYGWQKSLTGTGGWSDISGENDVNINLAASATSFYYRRKEVTGCGTTYSNVVFVEVLPPVVAGTVEFNQDICYNTAPLKFNSLTLPSGGSGSFTYQWQTSVDGATNWTNINDANGLEYEHGSMVSSLHFRRREVNTCATVNSNKITINVGNPVTIGAISGDQYICKGTSAQAFQNLLLPTGGVGVWGYQWQSSLDGVVWDNVPGATNSVYTTGSLNSDIYFRRKELNTCSDQQTNNVFVDVTEDLNGGEISNNQTVCYGSVPQSLSSLSAPSGGKGDWTYKWQRSVSGTGNWVDVVGEEGLSLILPASYTSMYYRRVSSNSCGSVNSNMVFVEVLPEVVAGVVGSVQSVCSGVAPSPLTNVSSPSGGNGFFGVNWQISGDGVNGWTDLEGEVNEGYDPGLLSSTKYFRRKEVNTCSTVFSNVVKITVGNPVNAGAIIGNQDVCRGSDAVIANDLLPTGGLGSWGFQWQESDDNSTFTNINGANLSAYNVISVQGTKYFRRNESNQCGSFTTSSVRVKVASDLEGGTIGSNQLICSGSAPATITGLADPSGGVGGWNYGWQYSLTGTGNWVVVGNETSSSLSPATVNVKTFYRRIENNSCGTVYSNPVVIDIRGTYTAGVVGYDQTICNGVVPQAIQEVTTPSGGVDGYTFLWQRSVNNMDWFDINGAVGSVYYPPSNGEKTFYRRMLTEFCGSVFTNVVTIDVKPILNGGTIGSSQDLCPGENPMKIESLSVASGGMANYLYQWQRAIGVSDEWTDVNGAIAVDFMPSSFSSGSRRFRRKVSDNCGVQYSNEVTIKINEIANPGIIGSNQTICFGAVPDNIVSVADASGWEGEFSYRWLVSQNGSDNWVVLENQLTSSLSLGILNDTKFYRRDVVYRCGVASSNVVKISVLPEFLAGEIFGTQNICFNQTPIAISETKRPVGGSGSFSHKWQKREVDGDWQDILGANLYIYQPPIYEKTTILRRIDVNGCGEKPTNEVTISVLGDFFPGRIGADQSILFGEVPNKLIGVDDPEGGLGANTFQWRVSLDSLSWSNVSGATEKDYQPNALLQTTYFRRRTVNQTCGEKTTNAVIVRVSQDLNPGVVGSEQTICYNEVPEKLIEKEVATGGNGVYEYQWQVGLDGISWENILNANGKDYQPDRLLSSKYYRRRVKSGSLEKNTGSILVSVKPLVISPVVNTNDLYCKGSLVKLEVSNPYSSSKWYNENMLLLGEGVILYLESIEGDRMVYVKSFDSDLCESSLSEVKVNVDRIKAEYTHSIVGGSVQEGSRVDFYGQSQGSVRWEWDFGIGDIYVVENPYVYYNFSGVYDVRMKVWSTIGCSDERVDVGLVVVSGQSTDVDANDMNRISIYPNPFKTDLSIEAERIESVHIYDTKGSLVFRKEYDREDSVSIDLGALRSGLYLVRIGSNKVYSTVKIIKE